MLTYHHKQLQITVEIRTEISEIKQINHRSLQISKIEKCSDLIYQKFLAVSMMSFVKKRRFDDDDDECDELDTNSKNQI